MKELISEEEWDELPYASAFHEMRNEINQRHKEAMKQRAIEFAERWLITSTIDYEDIRIEESYNKIY